MNGTGGAVLVLIQFRDGGRSGRVRLPRLASPRRAVRASSQPRLLAIPLGFGHDCLLSRNSLGFDSLGSLMARLDARGIARQGNRLGFAGWRRCAGSRVLGSVG